MLLSYAKQKVKARIALENDSPKSGDSSPQQAEGRFTINTNE